MPKTPEEIIASFEDRFGYLDVYPNNLIPVNDVMAGYYKQVDWLHTELAAYRLSLLSECLELVEDRILGAGVAGMIFDGADIAKTAFSNFNAANALWRERIKKMME